LQICNNILYAPKMISIEKILDNPKVQAFGGVVTVAIVLITAAIIIDKYYSAKKTRQEYILNQYKLEEAKKQNPNLKINNL
jgi:hypothetical protein